MSVETLENAKALDQRDEERSGFRKVYDGVMDDVTSYINEYVAFICGSKANQYLITRVDNTSNEDTVEQVRRQGVHASDGVLSVLNQTWEMRRCCKICPWMCVLVCWIHQLDTPTANKQSTLTPVSRTPTQPHHHKQTQCSRDILERVSKANTVVMYAKPNCGFCARAQAALKEEQSRTPFELDIVYGAHKNATIKGMCLSCLALSCQMIDMFRV